MEKQALQRLKRELSLLDRSPHPNFIARPAEADMLTWHYVLFDLPVESPYAGGIYHGKLVFPREYPLKPPSILMCTPSGRFEVNKRLCLSMSDYHPETWNPSWRVETIVLGLISFMLDETDPATAGGIVATRWQRKNAALLSFFRNLHNKDFRTLFPELCDAGKYYAGFGFSKAERTDESRKSLIDLQVPSREVDAVFNADDLRTLLSQVSGEGNDAPSTVQEKKFTMNILPLLAIGGLVVVWLMTDKG